MKLIKCDMCESTAQEETEALFWFRLQRVGHIRRDHEPDEWHVCSWTCLFGLGKQGIEGLYDDLFKKKF